MKKFFLLLLMLITITSQISWTMESAHNSSDKKSNMLLHAAALKGDAAVCRQLIRKHADVNEKGGPHERTPLHYAAAAGYVSPCFQLIAAGANWDSMDKAALTPLSIAIMRNHFEVVKTILITPLRSEYKKMRASRCGLIAIRLAEPTLPKDVRLLIDRHLIHSFAQDHLALMEKILAHNPNQHDRYLAERMKRNEIVRLLDIQNPATAKLILQEIKPLIRRLLIPKPRFIIAVPNPHVEIQHPDIIESVEDSEKSSDENTATKENPWEFL